MLKKSTAAVLGWMSILAFVILVLDVLLGVFTRKVLGDQIRWTEELARFLLIWVAFLGGALAYLDDKHLGVDILVSHFDPSARRGARIFTHAMVLLFSLLVMGIGGTMLVAERFQSGQTLPAMQIQKAWMYLAVPVCGYVISIFAIGNLWNMITGRSLETSDSEEGAS